MMGKVKQVITMEIYDENGQFLGKQAKYIYKPLLTWYDLVAGILLALFIGTQVMV